MTIRRTFLNTDSLCCVCFVHVRVCLQAYPLFEHSSSSATFVANPLSGWVCQWKPFWILVGDSIKGAFVEEWVFISGEPSDGQNTKDVPVLHSTDHADCFPETPRTSRQFDSQPTKPQDKACFWERIEAPLSPLRPRPKCNFIHPRQLGPFPGRLELPFSMKS